MGTAGPEDGAEDKPDDETGRLKEEAPEEAEDDAVAATRCAGVMAFTSSSFARTEAK